MEGFIQFEIWKDCNQGCPFCTSQGIPYARNKLESLKYVSDVLNKTGNWNSISLIGGEIFDGQLSNPEVKDQFYKVINHIGARINTGRSHRFLICTSIMYNDLSDLDYFLQYLKERDLTKRTVLCTSWDTAYRFNEVTNRNWQNNMRYLHQEYPELRTHVQAIMTQAMVESLIHGMFSPREFEDNWKTTLDFNTPYKCYGKYADKKEMELALPGFFPKRNSFLEMLWRNKDMANLDLHRLHDVSQHCTCYHHTFNDKDWIVLNNRHSRNHTCVKTWQVCQNKCCGYIDSDRKLHEDVQSFLKSYSL